MLTDYDEWREFVYRTGEELRNQSYEGEKIISYLVEPAFYDLILTDVVVSKDSLNVYRCKWNKGYDSARLLNPLEKVKLLGKIQPTLERETVILPEEKAQQLKEHYQVAMEKEIKLIDNRIVLDGISYQLRLISKFHQKQYEWQVGTELPLEIIQLIELIEKR